MTGPIHPDRFDQLCEAERRLAVIVSDVGTHAAHMSIGQFREWFKRNYGGSPGLLEERIEVQANG